GTYTFGWIDFPYYDYDYYPYNNLAGVKIETLPGTGALTLNGAAVPAGQLITAAEIAGGMLKFSPAANAVTPSATSFKFRVKDDGGTANGGIDTDPLARTLTIQVLAGPNQMPTGNDHTITSAREDVAYTIGVSDFPFADADNNALAAVKVTTVPASG